MAKKKIAVEVVGQELGDEPVKPSPVKSNMYTYIGGGESSPAVIEFMGVQRFVRGQPTEVTSAVVLAKLANNPCFVEGEVSQVEIHEYDEKARVEADKQRSKDASLNKAYKKRHGEE